MERIYSSYWENTPAYYPRIRVIFEGKEINQFVCTAIPNIDDTISLGAGESYSVKDVIWGISFPQVIYVDLVVEKL